MVAYLLVAIDAKFLVVKGAPVLLERLATERYLAEARLASSCGIVAVDNDRRNTSNHRHPRILFSLAERFFAQHGLEGRDQRDGPRLKVLYFNSVDKMGDSCCEPVNIAQTVRQLLYKFGITFTETLLRSVK